MIKMNLGERYSKVQIFFGNNSCIMKVAFCHDLDNLIGLVYIIILLLGIYKLLY